MQLLDAGQNEISGTTHRRDWNVSWRKGGHHGLFQREGGLLDLSWSPNARDGWQRRGRCGYP